MKLRTWSVLGPFMLAWFLALSGQHPAQEVKP